MNWNNHSRIEGMHAFLGGSKYHWINYSDEKLATSYKNFLAVEKGTIMHDLACKLIRNEVKLPDLPKTLNLYVNDAIGYKMTPEQPLYYSDNCFGTADAISFRKEKGVEILRIHDLKTGASPTHIEQLEIYAALFCLEYKKKPGDIEIELRIYQSNKVVIHNPTPEEIVPIMDKIVTFDKIISKIQEEES